MPRVVHRQGDRNDETRRGRLIGTGQRVLDRDLESARILEPGGGAAMKLRRRPGLPALELGPEVLGQDVVEPVGGRTARERRDETIVPGQRPQALRRSAHPGHGLGDRRFDDLEDR